MEEEKKGIIDAIMGAFDGFVSGTMKMSDDYISREDAFRLFEELSNGQIFVANGTSTFDPISCTKIRNAEHAYDLYFTATSKDDTKYFEILLFKDAPEAEIHYYEGSPSKKTSVDLHRLANESGSWAAEIRHHGTRQ